MDYFAVGICWFRYWGFLLFAVPSKWFAELVPLCIALAGIILLFPHHPKQSTGTMAGNSKLLVNRELVSSFRLSVFLLLEFTLAFSMQVLEY